MVDDSAEIRQAVRVALRDRFEVSAAENLDQGRSQLAAGAFDVVFLDLMLPDGNGLDFVAEVRRSDSDTAVVVITAHGTLDNAIRALNEGASFYLQKPFRRESVQACAGQMAERVRLLRENRKLLRDLRATVEDLRSSQAEVVKNEKLAAVGRLAAGMAHEINNPLQAVLGFADLLTKGTLEERVRRDLRMITANAERIRRIVRGMMAFGRAAGGPWKPVDLNPVVRRAVEEAQREGDASRVETLVDCAADLPPVHANDAYLQQVVQNVVVNALQAMPGGGRLEVRTRALEGWVEVEVRDTGVGIAPEHLDRVYDPFFTTRPTGEGAGLGLSFAYGVVKDYGGEIRIESQPGRGTTVVVRLPSRPVAVERAEAPPPRLPEDAVRVLVVDDDEGAREVLARILAASPTGPCLVRTAASGAEALEALDGDGSDVVFADIHMPGMDGLELLRLGKERHPRVRFVMMTGYTDLYSAKDAMRLGADEYITKPLHFNEVLMVVDKVMLRTFAGVGPPAAAGS